jgi:hypothetical protein
MRTNRGSDMTKLIVGFRDLRMRLKIPAVYLKRNNSALCRWIYTVQNEVPVLKLTAFS